MTDRGLPSSYPAEYARVSLTLQDLITQYPVLTHLAQYLSTLDLFHLALTCRTFHAHVLSSSSVLTHLKRTAICDGRGLIQRQNFEGLYSVESKFRYIWGNTRKIWQDEPIEVQLYATKCDEAGALPCLRCGINVCEVPSLLSDTPKKASS